MPVQIRDTFVLYFSVSNRLMIIKWFILCPRLGAEWIGRISWLSRAPLGPIFMTIILTYWQTYWRFSGIPDINSWYWHYYCHLSILVLTIILNVCASSINVLTKVDGYPEFRKPIHDIDIIIVNTGIDNNIERVRPAYWLDFSWNSRTYTIP